MVRQTRQMLGGLDLCGTGGMRGIERRILMRSGTRRSPENRYPLSQDCPLTAGESLCVFVPHVTVVRQRNKDLCLSKLQNLLVLSCCMTAFKDV